MSFGRLTVSVAFNLAAVTAVVATAGLSIGLSAGCKKATPPPARTDRPIALFIDERQVATSASLSTAPRALVEVVPGVSAPETWLAVIAIAADGQATTIMAPAREHADAIPALAVDARGAVAFGLAKGGVLTSPVAPLAKVIVKTKDDRGAVAAEVMAKGNRGGGDGEGHRHDGDGERPAPTAALTITVETAAGPTVLTGDKLTAVPSITAPIGDTETPGWHILDLLTAAGVTTAPTTVTLVDPEGTALTLTGGDLDRALTILYVKLNRGGQLRFRRFAKRGTTWEMTGELRGLGKIVVK
jgi:hypothetical protein